MDFLAKKKFLELYIAHYDALIVLITTKIKFNYVFIFFFFIQDRKYKFYYSLI